MIISEEEMTRSSGLLGIMSRIDRVSNRSLWLIVFLYALIVGLLIQLVALPVFLPQLDSGNGLLAGTDTACFQELAIQQSRVIRETGWSAWKLYPLDETAYSIAGIASAVYAFANSESPALLIPLNAVIHATSALILVHLVSLLTNSRRGAIVACLPFVIFPSSLNWISQIHKDGIFILGMLLSLYGLVRLARLETWQQGPKKILFSYVLLMSGFGITWFIRPYGLQLLFVFSGIVYLPSIGLLLYYAQHRQIPGKCVGAHAVLFGLFVTSLAGFLFSPISQSVDPGEIESLVEPENRSRLMEECSDSKELQVTPLPVGGASEWQATSWLPPSLDQQLHTLSIFRDNVLTFGGDTDIDRDARMSSALDFIAYIPRALQIALFAPFANQWFGSGSLGNLSAMRPIVGLEMLISYLLLPFIVYAIWRWRYPQLWLTLGFCLFFMVLYSYITPNAGTLHRVRYGFITTLLTICVVAVWNLIMQWLESRKAGTR